MSLHIGNSLTYRAVGLYQTIIKPLLEPVLELVHNRLAIGLVIRQAVCRAHLLVTGLVLMVEDLFERFDHHLALCRKDVFQVAELTTAVRQTVAANEPVLISLIARQGVGHHQRFVQTRLALLQQGLEVFPRMRAA